MNRRYTENPGAEPLWHRIVETVAVREGAPPSQLDALYESVDTDGLELLLDDARDRNDVVSVRFAYHGYDVTATSEGDITLSERDESKKDDSHDDRSLTL